MSRHYAIRPPACATQVERLTDSGEWIADDGRPGMAFTGLLNGDAPGDAPYGFACHCGCDATRYGDPSCPMRLAMSRMSSRYGVANGRYMPPVAA